MYVGVVTVTVQVAVLFPSTVVTVIVAVPAALAVIVPLLTVATVVLLEDHVTFWLVAPVGVNVKVRFCVPFTLREIVFGVSVTPVTATAVLLTVTAQVAVLFWSAVVTVIVAVPAALAVTVPSLTVAMAASLVVHVMFLFVALSGATVAVSFSVPFTSMVVLGLFSVTPVTATVVWSGSGFGSGFGSGHPVSVRARTAVIRATFNSFFLRFNGERRTENGERRTENGERRTENGERFS